VSFQVATHQAEGYTVETEVYQGPLDLLLELIERAELDITHLALAQVTDQYLAYLKQLEERNAAEVSAFLVIAARLIQIKSAALLPRPALPSVRGDEEDPAEALARQLILYKRFKELAGELEARQNAGWRTYLRVAAPPKMAVTARLDLTGVTIEDLMQAARDIFAHPGRLPELSQVVNMPRITIRERIKVVLDGLRQLGKTSFRKLISPQASRTEIVVTFLAMLELIKQHIIQANQNALFSDIDLQAEGSLEDKENVEVEFVD